MPRLVHYDLKMAQDGWRVVNWNYGDFDARFARAPVSYGVAAGGPSFREAAAWLELPAKSAVAGTLIALLFAWPVLMVARFFGAFSARAFGVMLALVAFISSIGCWAVSSAERRTWARRRERLPDHEDPPPWK